MVTLPVTPSLTARISACPALSPVTRPVGDTEATAAVAVVHSKLRPSSTVPVASFAVAESCTVCPTSIEDSGAVTVTVLTGPGVRPRGTIEGEAELFTGSDSDWVGDIRRLQDLGVTSVDVRLFGYGEAQTLQGTIDNMHRFRDGVLSKLA